MKVDVLSQTSDRLQIHRERNRKRGNAPTAVASDAVYQPCVTTVDATLDAPTTTKCEIMSADAMLQCHHTAMYLIWLCYCAYMYYLETAC